MSIRVWSAVRERNIILHFCLSKESTAHLDYTNFGMLQATPMYSVHRFAISHRFGIFPSDLLELPIHQRWNTIGVVIWTRLSGNLQKLRDGCKWVSQNQAKLIWAVAITQMIMISLSEFKAYNYITTCAQKNSRVPLRMVLVLLLINFLVKVAHFKKIA